MLVETLLFPLRMRYPGNEVAPGHSQPPPTWVPLLLEVSVLIQADYLGQEQLTRPPLWERPCLQGKSSTLLSPGCAVPGTPAQVQGHNTQVQACISGSSKLTLAVNAAGHCPFYAQTEERWRASEGPSYGTLAVNAERRERTWGGAARYTCLQAWLGSQQVSVALNFKGWTVTFKTQRDLY